MHKYSTCHEIMSFSGFRLRIRLCFPDVIEIGVHWQGIRKRTEKGRMVSGDGTA